MNENVRNYNELIIFPQKENEPTTNKETQQKKPNTLEVK